MSQVAKLFIVIVLFQLISSAGVSAATPIVEKLAITRFPKLHVKPKTQLLPSESVCALLKLEESNAIQKKRRWIQCWDISSKNPKTVRVIPIDSNKPKLAQFLPTYDQCAFADFAGEIDGQPACYRVLQALDVIPGDLSRKGVRGIGRSGSREIAKIFSISPPKRTKLFDGNYTSKFELPQTCVATIDKDRRDKEYEYTCFHFKDGKMSESFFEGSKRLKGGRFNLSTLQFTLGWPFSAYATRIGKDSPNQLFGWGKFGAKVEEKKLPMGEVFNSKNAKIHTVDDGFCVARPTGETFGLICQLGQGEKNYSLETDFGGKSSLGYSFGELQGVNHTASGGQFMCFTQEGAIRCLDFGFPSRIDGAKAKPRRAKRIFDLPVNSISFDASDLFNEMQIDPQTLAALLRSNVFGSRMAPLYHGLAEIAEGDLVSESEKAQTFYLNLILRLFIHKEGMARRSARARQKNPRNDIQQVIFSDFEGIYSHLIKYENPYLGAFHAQFLSAEKNWPTYFNSSWVYRRELEKRHPSVAKFKLENYSDPDLKLALIAARSLGVFLSTTASKLKGTEFEKPANEIGASLGQLVQDDTNDVPAFFETVCGGSYAGDRYNCDSYKVLRASDGKQHGHYFDFGMDIFEYLAFRLAPRKTMR